MYQALVVSPRPGVWEIRLVPVGVGLSVTIPCFGIAETTKLVKALTECSPIIVEAQT